MLNRKDAKNAKKSKKRFFATEHAEDAEGTEKQNTTEKAQEGIHHQGAKAQRTTEIASSHGSVVSRNFCKMVCSVFGFFQYAKRISSSSRCGNVDNPKGYPSEVGRRRLSTERHFHNAYAVVSLLSSELFLDADVAGSFALPGLVIFDQHGTD